jgi:hypothetical protein
VSEYPRAESRRGARDDGLGQGATEKAARGADLESCPESDREEGKVAVGVVVAAAVGERLRFLAAVNCVLEWPPDTHCLTVLGEYCSPFSRRTSSSLKHVLRGKKCSVWSWEVVEWDGGGVFLLLLGGMI